MHPHPQPNPWIGYAVTAVVLVVVMTIRFRRMNVDRPLKLEWLWVLPCVYFLLAGVMFYGAPPAGIGWAFCVVAVMVGAALGWQRGKMIHVAVDPETHKLSARQSPAAMMFIVVLILVRFAMRAAMQNGAAGSLHIDLATATDILIAMALGLLTVQRVEMYLRARRLLEEAGAA